MPAFMDWGSVHETEAIAVSREMLTHWLATKDQGAEPWTDLEAACQRHEGICDVTYTAAGRTLVDTVVSDLSMTL